MQNPDHTLVTPPKEQRFTELDAVRGLAALSVVFLHFHDAWYIGLPHPVGPLQIVGLFFLRLIYTGRSAVFLFFVLSGFVLSLPLLRGKHQPYSTYVVRRILRIWAPYVCSLLLALLGSAIFYRYPHGSSWMGPYWNAPLDASLIFQHIFLIGIFDTQRYNYVVWTLVQEMRLSIIFPFLFALVIRMRMWSLLLVAGAMALAPVLTGFRNITVITAENTFRKSFGITVYVVGYFIAGILLAVYLENIKSWWKKSSYVTKLAFSVATIYCYGYGFAAPELSRRLVIHHLAPGPVLNDGLVNTFFMLGALGVLIVCLNARLAKRILHARVSHGLGRMSYSLYLIHPTVLGVITLLLYYRMSRWLQLPIYIALALAASWLFCIYVEEPFIRLSRGFRAQQRRS